MVTGFTVILKINHLMNDVHAYLVGVVRNDSVGVRFGRYSAGSQERKVTPRKSKK